MRRNFFAAAAEFVGEVVFEIIPEFICDLISSLSDFS